MIGLMNTNSRALRAFVAAIVLSVAPALPAQTAESRPVVIRAAAVLECHGRRAEIARTQRRWVESHATLPAVASELLRVYARYLAGAAVPLAGAKGLR